MKYKIYVLEDKPFIIQARDSLELQLKLKSLHDFSAYKTVTIVRVD